MRKVFDMCAALDMRCAREGAISYRIAKQYIEFSEGKYIELCAAKHIDKSRKSFAHIEDSGEFAANLGRETRPLRCGLAAFD